MIIQLVAYCRMSDRGRTTILPSASTYAEVSDTMISTQKDAYTIASHTISPTGQSLGVTRKNTKKGVANAAYMMGMVLHTSQMRRNWLSGSSTNQGCKWGGGHWVRSPAAFARL